MHSVGLARLSTNEPSVAQADPVLNGRRWGECNLKFSFRLAGSVPHELAHEAAAAS